ncbi:hypothetical protein JB92DRAFT_2852256 [Gautieria morchelliformis]|nr:hypothetical protein JB92DRAFT_2852256 [Gautieria morchelliformis]
MDMVSQSTVALVLLLRTYALWGRNLLILVLIGTVGLGIPGIGIWSVVLTSCVNVFDTSVASQLNLITMLFSLISVVFDLLIVVFTGIRWYQLWRSMKLTEGDLALLIMRNGIVQYTFVFLGQLSTVIMFWTAPVSKSGVAPRYESLLRSSDGANWGGKFYCSVIGSQHPFTLHA